MIHATSEYDMTSLATSSPRSSPAPKPPPQPPAVYYVQSPSSRDSHDQEDKSSTSASATATQATSTPVGYRSPSDSLLSLFSRQSRSSSASRVSGPHGYRHKRGRRDRAGRRLLGHVAEGEEEEGRKERELYVNWWKDEDGEEFSRSCKGLMGVMVLGLAFMITCFIIWGASRPFSTQVFLKKMSVNNFYLGEGSDQTGVPTKMLTINCSLKMRVHNPATFFGIYVSCSTINLRYFDLTLASGHLETYYQPKQSWQTVTVNIQGSNVPLYGAGAGFVVANSVTDGVPMILDFEISSQGDVVGKLVKSKHHQRVSCSFSISSHTTQIVKFAGDSCLYK